MKLHNGTSMELIPYSEGGYGCILLRSKAGRIYEERDEVGASDIAGLELRRATITWAIASGGYASAQPSDECFLFYILFPQHKLEGAVHQLFHTLTETPTEAQFLKLRQQVLAEGLAQAGTSDGQLPRFAYGRHFQGYPGTSTRDRVKGCGSLSYDAYLKFRLRLLDNRNNRFFVATPSNQDAVVKKLEQTFGTYEGRQFSGFAKPNPCAVQFCKQDQHAVGIGFRWDSPSIKTEGLAMLLNAMLGMRQSNLTQAYYFSSSEFGYWSILSRPTDGSSLFSTRDIASEIAGSIAQVDFPKISLDRAKTMLEKRILSHSEGPLGIAFMRSHLSLLNCDWTVDEIVDKVRNVSSSDVAGFLEQCTNDNRELIVAAQEEAEGKHLLSDFSRYFDRFVSSGESSVGFWQLVPGEDELLFPPPRSEASVLQSVHQLPQRYQENLPLVLSGGLNVVIRSIEGNHLDYFGLYVRGGRIFENESNCGVSQVLLSSILASTPGVEVGGDDLPNYYSLSKGAQWLGSYLEADVTADISGIRGSVLKRNFARVIESITDNFFSPELPHDRVIDWVKTRLLERGQKRKRDLFHRTVDLYYKTVFGTHPYGLPRFGNERSVDGMSRHMLQDWHNGWVVPSRATLSVVTSRPVEEIVKVVSQWNYLGGDSGDHAPAEILSLSQYANMGRVVEAENRDDSNSAFVIGFPVSAGKNLDAIFRLDVLQHALAGPGGLLASSPLNGIMQTRAFYVPLSKGGVFFVYVEYKGCDAAEVRDLVQKKLESVASRGLEKDQLVRAKNFTAGSYKMAMQSPMHRIYEMSRSQLLYGGTLTVESYIRAVEQVRKSDVRDVAKEFFDWNKQTAVLLRSAYEMA